MSESTTPAIYSPPSVRFDDFASDRSLPQLLVDRVATNPDRVMINDLTTGRAVTYEVFHAEVLDWARGLAARGVRAGDAVLIDVPNTVDGYVIWLAASWLRAIPVPINIALRGNMLRHVIETSGARLGIVATPFLELFDAVREDLTQLRTIVVSDGDPQAGESRFALIGRDELLAQQADIDETPPGRADPSQVIFTGGTTGPSKGALVAWGYSATFADFPADIQGENCVLYSTWPLWHSAGHYAFANIVYRNGTLVLRDRWHTAQFWPDARATGVTATMLLGGVANLLWQAKPSEEDRDNPLQRISIQPMVMDHEAFAERFDVKVQSGYGLSEGGGVLLCQHPMPNGRTCGRPNPGFNVKLLNDAGEEVASGEVGELWIRPDDPTEIFTEYLNMPEASAAARVDGWFKTGDAFVRDEEGFFYFQDRLKDCIRRRGENISSLEVEKEINAHPAVMESGAVAVRDELGGEEVLVFVVLHEGAELTATELTDYLEPRLPRYMIPRYTEFIPELPKTPDSGRIRKLELRDRGLGAATWDREAGAWCTV